MQPGSAAASSLNPATSHVPLGVPAVFARRRNRHLVPAEGVQQPGGVAAEPAQQRLSRRPLDGESLDPTQKAAVSIDVVEIEDLSLAVEFIGVPFRAAVEPARHLLPQRHSLVAQRQEQAVDALFGCAQRRERREGDAGAQVHQDRVHRLGAEILGQFFADRDVADRLALAEPQRLQRSGPVRPPRQFHVVEGLEQLLRTHALHPLDRRVDRLHGLGCRLVFFDARDRGPVGVQRPVGVPEHRTGGCAPGISSRRRRRADAASAAPHEKPSPAE